MSKICLCNANGVNMGFRNCPKTQEPFVEVLVPKYGSDGTENSINIADIDDPLTRDAYFLKKLQEKDPVTGAEIDPRDRWYIIVGIEDFETDRPDPDFKTYTSGKKIPLRDKPRMVKEYFPLGSPLLAGKSEGWKCIKQFGTFKIDLEGSIIGARSSKLGDGFLIPQPIDGDSLFSKFKQADKNGSQEVYLTYDLLRSFNDGDMKMITGSSLNPTNLLELFADGGLLDVHMNVVSASAADNFLVIDLLTEEGDLMDPIGVYGMDITDFVHGATDSVVFDKTAQVELTITSIVVDPDISYRYKLNFAPGDLLVGADRIEVDGNFGGFDFADVRATPITVVV